MVFVLFLSRLHAHYPAEITTTVRTRGHFVPGNPSSVEDSTPFDIAVSVSYSIERRAFSLRRTRTEGVVNENWILLLIGIMNRDNNGALSIKPSIIITMPSPSAFPSTTVRLFRSVVSPLTASLSSAFDDWTHYSFDHLCNTRDTVVSLFAYLSFADVPTIVLRSYYAFLASARA